MVYDHTDLGGVPCVIGEIGIPYDMDGKAAYINGDYSSQTRAMDANMCALERDLVNFTLCNYCSDNSHKWGDQWNGEDLSIWSPPFPTMANANERDIPIDLNAGARALEAFVRPYPILTPGLLTSINFNLKELVFSCTYKHRVTESGKWDTEEEGITKPCMELYLPRLHFPDPETTSVWVSCGTFEFFPDQQRCTWKCDCALDEVPVGSVSSTEPMMKTKTMDCVVTHKIVIRRKGKDGAVRGDEVPRDIDDEEVTPLCPECVLM